LELPTNKEKAEKQKRNGGGIVVDEMIRYGTMEDLGLLGRYDTHISEEELRNAVDQKRVLIMYAGQRFVGWLRYHLFWDQIPFLSMVYFLEGERRKGYGRSLVEFWEGEMRGRKYDRVLTSTLSSEEAQHFYRNMGYVDCGSLLLPGEPLEIILQKELVGR